MYYIKKWFCDQKPSFYTYTLLVLVCYLFYPVQIKTRKTLSCYWCFESQKHLGSLSAGVIFNRYAQEVRNCSAKRSDLPQVSNWVPPALKSSTTDTTPRQSPHVTDVTSAGSALTGCYLVTGCYFLEMSQFNWHICYNNTKPWKIFKNIFSNDNIAHTINKV